MNRWHESPVVRVHNGVSLYINDDADLPMMMMMMMMMMLMMMFMFIMNYDGKLFESNRSFSDLTTRQSGNPATRGLESKVGPKHWKVPQFSRILL